MNNNSKFKRSVYRKMGEVTEEVRKLEHNVETSSNTGEMEDIQINISNEFLCRTYNT